MMIPGNSTITADQVMNLTPRPCPLCESTDSETFYSKRHFVRNLKSAYLFDHNISLCTRCGFCFQSPCYEATQLERWYADSMVTGGPGALDYNVDKRISLIQSLQEESAVPLRSFAEFGANNRTIFHGELERMFSRISAFDINRSSPFSGGLTDDWKDGSVDMLAVYFVLEHTPDLRGCFDLFRKKLCRGGILIIEVPDLAQYGEDLSGMLLFEHVNHFSMQSLEKLAANHGFRLLKASRESCSRDFGFAAVFAKEDTAPEKPYQLPNECETARYWIESGLSLIEANRKACRSLYDSLKGEEFVIWCANDNMERFIESLGAIPAEMMVVDMNRTKQSVYAGIVSVHHPDEALKHPPRNLLIASPLNTAGILENLRSRFGSAAEKIIISIIDFTRPLGVGSFNPNHTAK